jgi:hypothetical protein
LKNGRAGEEYALGFARDALVAEDNGAFRAALITLKEEGFVESGRG